MIKTFDEVWCEAEELNKKNLGEKDDLFQETILKIEFFKTISKNDKMPADELKNAKEYIMGEILFSLTAVSLAEDINVYAALQKVNRSRNIDLLSKVQTDLINKD